MYGQARPLFSDFFLARFTRAITRCVIGLPLQLDGCARGGAPFFLREKRAGLGRGITRSAERFPLVSPQRNGVTTAQANRAAVRSALPNGLAKQTEKESETEGQVYLHIRIQTFFIRIAAS